MLMFLWWRYREEGTSIAVLFGHRLSELPSYIEPGIHQFSHLFTKSTATFNHSCIDEPASCTLVVLILLK